MASSASGNNALELMTTGEKSGQWGDITNTNLQIIDRATKGVGSIALSGTTYSLDTVDYTLSEGQYAVLVFSGSPGGACTVTINPNDQQKVFIVKNDADQSVIMTQGSGGNVTIASGASAIIYSDGAGTGAKVVDVTAFFTTASNTQTFTNKSIDLTDNTLTATFAELNTAVSDATLVSTTGTDTLTNKTIDLTDNTVTGTFSEFNTAVSDATLVSTSSTDTLTNKTVNLSSNTLTGTTAEFNTALSDGSFATLAGTETLTNKTLTSPSASDPTFTGAVYANGSYRGNLTAVAALDIDCSDGNYFTKSISANSTFTFSNAPSSRSYGFVLRLSITGTPTITWPASVYWPDNLEPTWSSGAVNLYVFITDDGGTTWRGAALTDYAG